MSEHKPVFSIELVLVIGIPLLTVIAGIITVVIATTDGFTPAQAKVDRFGQQLETTE